jgi:hypothetical protein
MDGALLDSSGLYADRVRRRNATHTAARRPSTLN